MDNHKNKYQLMSNKKVNQYLMNKVNKKCQKMKYNNKFKWYNNNNNNWFNNNFNKMKN